MDKILFVWSSMPPVTPKRIRLSLAEKAIIIEEFEKSGFDKKKVL